MNITKTPFAPTPASVATNAARSAAPARDASAATVVATSNPKTATAPATAKIAAAGNTGESVSVSKVAQMRAAIESGTFKVDAGKIADGLIRSGDLAR